MDPLVHQVSEAALAEQLRVAGRRVTAQRVDRDLKDELRRLGLLREADNRQQTGGDDCREEWTWRVGHGSGTDS